MAFNIALYGPGGNVWCMTERGSGSLRRDAHHLHIGPSSLSMHADRLLIDFAETALPWPGQRLWPKAVSGRVELFPDIHADRLFDLDPAGRHVWSPRMPRAMATITCDALPGGGWRGRAYHDMNYGDRPLEQDFIGWDWARGHAAADGDTVILYDALLRQGSRRRLALRYDAQQGEAQALDLPDRQGLPPGFWGVRAGIGCDMASSPRLLDRLEDSPFYTRSRVETTLSGRRLEMMQETLDCRRLSHPLVRLMLPFRMPRRRH
ncbi:MAG: carotenoid 1,2-hydratase [Niveispirillum sp.]|uniref:carotenoid 1,2-hydratase n=1 Tax=Niveispirillum sp. TaxID=1917217 RepID=UPI003BA495C4